MIDLTPLEVRKKREDFRRALRGYEPADVDNFLELVADRLEQLVKENLTLAERVARLEAEVGEYRERERALTDALVTAQEMREELRRQAAKDAELLRREAEAEAARLRAATLQALEREEEELRRLRARRAQLVQSYRSFLEQELAELEALARALDAADLPAGATPAAVGPLTAPETGPGETVPAAAAPLDAAPAEPLAPAAAEAAKGEAGARPGGGDFPDGMDWLSSLLREEP